MRGGRSPRASLARTPWRRTAGASSPIAKIAPSSRSSRMRTRKMRTVSSTSRRSSRSSGLLAHLQRERDRRLGGRLRRDRESADRARRAVPDLVRRRGRRLLLTGRRGGERSRRRRPRLNRARLERSALPRPPRTTSRPSTTTCSWETSSKCHRHAPRGRRVLARRPRRLAGGLASGQRFASRTSETWAETRWGHICTWPRCRWSLTPVSGPLFEEASSIRSVPQAAPSCSGSHWRAKGRRRCSSSKSASRRAHCPLPWPSRPRSPANFSFPVSSRPTSAGRWSLRKWRAAERRGSTTPIEARYACSRSLWTPRRRHDPRRRGSVERGLEVRELRGGREVGKGAFGVFPRSSRRRRRAGELEGGGPRGRDDGHRDRVATMTPSAALPLAAHLAALLFASGRAAALRRRPARDFERQGRSVTMGTFCRTTAARRRAAWNCVDSASW